MKRLRQDGIETAGTYFPQVGDWLYRMKVQMPGGGEKGAKATCGRSTKRKSISTLHDACQKGFNPVGEGGSLMTNPTLKALAFNMITLANTCHI